MEEPPTAAQWAQATADDAKRLAQRREIDISTEAANRAIRTAQRLLRARAETFKDVEVGYNNWTENPRKLAYRAAAKELDVLIEPEKEN